MAKKAAAKGGADLPISPDARQRVPTKQKPSALVTPAFPVLSSSFGICNIEEFQTLTFQFSLSGLLPDIFTTSCSVMAKRLRDHTTLREDEDLWKVGRGFVVQNLPFTEERLRKMPAFEFENWAVKQLNGRANKVQIGDMGIRFVRGSRLRRHWVIRPRPQNPAADRMTPAPRLIRAFEMPK